ncbi:MAG: filamentous hemagglutinin N-terminal domain-containing protein [Rivularia sp. (in: cyanobacteria)]
MITNQTLAQQSNITPDNTLGAESSRLNRNVLINGINADTIDGGAIRNSNLFHSFSSFSINDGQAVYFVNPDGIQNILTRVTGGNQSNIFGTLGVDGAANLFLINPNGIVFGENASLDLQGSFLGTTASGLQFGEQGNFSATNPEIPGSLTVNPSALFFNQVEANGGIINNSQAPAGINPYGFETTGLRVPDGKSLLLVGGEIELDGGRLRAYEGNIELAAFTGEGTVGLNISGDNFSLNIPEDMERGDISLTNQSYLSVSGAGGGNFTINARNLEISDSIIFAGIAENSENPNVQAGNVNLNATGSIEFKGDTAIDNSVYSQGNAGDININAKSVLVAEDSEINSETLGIGNAGNININARESIFLQGAGNVALIDSNNSITFTGIFSLVRPEAIGNAGNIQLTTGTLSVSDYASIFSDTMGKGNAGNITINARNTVSFDNISSISSSILPEGIGKGGNIRVTAKNLALNNGSQISTAVLGKGNAGNIFIEASDSVKLDGFFGNPNAVSSIENLSDGILGVSSIQSDLLGFGVGKGGDIQITTNNLSVSNLAEISASTSGEGDAGNITINARDKVTFSDLGAANSIAINLFDFLPIPIDVGNGGDIRINTGELLLKNGGFLSTSNNGGKNAGNIFLDVRDTITFDGVASNGLQSNASTSTSNGSAGNIEVKTGSLFLTNGGYMSTVLSGEENADNIAKAGDIKINARNTVKIDGEFSSLNTNLLNGTGESGNIEIETKSLSITNNAALLTISGGKGNAGDIKLTAGTLFLDNRGFISTGTLDKGDAGNIQINSSNSILLSNSSRISSDVGFGAEGKGGSININTQDLTLIDGSRITSGLEGKGRGGEININASEFVNLSGIDSAGFFSGIFTSTGTGASGDAGNITVNTDNFRITDNAIVNARTFNDGNAGNITFNANTFAAINGGGITTTTFNSGKAGNINLNIKDKITLSGITQRFRSGLFASTSANSTGKGGSILIDPRLVIIENGAGVSVGSNGTGDAGDISLQAGTLQLNNGFITAQTASTQGGDINLQISDLLLLRNQSQTQPQELH